MKRKIALTAITISALIVTLITGMMAIEVVKANFFPGDALIIDSPEVKKF